MFLLIRFDANELLDRYADQLRNFEQTLFGVAVYGLENFTESGLLFIYFSQMFVRARRLFCAFRVSRDKSFICFWA